MQVLFLQGRQLSETLECFTWRPDKLTFLERPIYKKKIVVIRYFYIYINFILYTI